MFKRNKRIKFRRRNEPTENRTIDKIIVFCYINVYACKLNTFGTFGSLDNAKNTLSKIFFSTISCFSSRYKSNASVRQPKNSHTFGNCCVCGQTNKRKKKTRKIKRQPRKYVLHNKYATKTTQMRPKSSTLDLFYMCVCIVTVPLSTCYFQQ